MRGTYQSFIVEKAEEVLEILKEEVEITENAKEDLCILLTQRFLDGKLSMSDEGCGVFESEDEVDRFITLCHVHYDMEQLQERGLVGTYNDGESFFLTAAGKKYVEENLLKL